MDSKIVKLILEEMISIVETKGDDALTDIRIDECCKKHAVNTEEFKDYVISSMATATELSSESLNKVIGGSKSGLRKTAALMALLNVHNIIGAQALGKDAQMKDNLVTTGSAYAKREIKDSAGTALSSDDQLKTKSLAKERDKTKPTNGAKKIASKSPGLVSNLLSFLGGAGTMSVILGALIKSKSNEIASIKAELTQVNDEISDLKIAAKSAPTTEERDRLNQQIEEKNEEINRLNAQAHQLESEKSDLEGEKQTLNRQLHDEREATNRLRRENQQLETTKSELNRVKTTLEREKQTLTTNLAQKTTLLNNIATSVNAQREALSKTPLSNSDEIPEKISENTTQILESNNQWNNYLDQQLAKANTWWQGQLKTELGKKDLEIQALQNQLQQLTSGNNQLNTGLESLSTNDHFKHSSNEIFSKPDPNAPKGINFNLPPPREGTQGQPEPPANQPENQFMPTQHQSREATINEVQSVQQQNQATVSPVTGTTQQIQQQRSNQPPAAQPTKSLPQAQLQPSAQVIAGVTSCEYHLSNDPSKTFTANCQTSNRQDASQKAYRCLLVDEIFACYRKEPLPTTATLDQHSDGRLQARSYTNRTCDIEDKSEVITNGSPEISEPLGETRLPLNTKIYLTNSGSLQSLHSVLQTNRCTNESSTACVVNFANPTIPGGYSWWGWPSQEQSLCVTTDLLPKLCTANNNSKYYTTNSRFLDTARSKGQLNNLYNVESFADDFTKRSDYAVYTTCIFTQDVKQLKDANSPRLKDFLPSNLQHLLNVLTIAAPSINATYAQRLAKLPDNSPEYVNYLNLCKQQWRCVMRTAYSKGMKHIVLGALGCGKFNGNPYVVSRALCEVLKTEGPDSKTPWGNCFTTVSIPIFTQNPQSDYNYTAFKTTLGYYFPEPYTLNIM